MVNHVKTSQDDLPKKLPERTVRVKLALVFLLSAMCASAGCNAQQAAPKAAGDAKMADQDKKSAEDQKAPSKTPAIKPSPFQLPAEVDPPHRDPGDEVPK